MKVSGFCIDEALLRRKRGDFEKRNEKGDAFVFSPERMQKGVIFELAGGDGVTLRLGEEERKGDALVFSL
jgi:hypothetical protein